MGRVAYFEWLGQAVGAKLADKPIGDAVALRAYLQLASDHGLLIPTLAAALAMAGRWLGSPTGLYAQGGSRQGSVSALAHFSGRTALISSDLIRPGDGAGAERPTVTLLLIGNRGSLQFSDHPGADGLPVILDPPHGEGERNIRAMIEQSLRQQRPVTAGR